MDIVDLILNVIELIVSLVHITIKVICATVKFIYGTVKFICSDIYPGLKNAFSQGSAMKKGIVENARIITIMRTTILDDNSSVFKLMLRFKTVDGQIIISTIMKTLTIQEMESYKEGCQLTIKYIPGDPQKVSIVEDL